MSVDATGRSDFPKVATTILLRTLPCSLRQGSAFSLSWSLVTEWWQEGHRVVSEPDHWRWHGFSLALSHSLGTLVFETSYHWPSPLIKAMFQGSSCQSHIRPHRHVSETLGGSSCQPWICPHWCQAERRQAVSDELFMFGPAPTADSWTTPTSNIVFFFRSLILYPLQHHLRSRALHSFTSKEIGAHWDDVTHPGPHNELGFEPRAGLPRLMRSASAQTSAPSGSRVGVWAAS